MTSTTSYRPRDGATVCSLTDTTAQELDAVVASAAAAAPVLRNLHPTVRRAWLHALAEELEANAAELAELADAETALGMPRLNAEIARTAGQLRFYGNVAAEGSYLEVTIDSPTDTSPLLARVNRPIGPVAVFGASNFPFAFSVLGNDTASVLAAGCPVVVKAHPAHLALSLRLAELTKAVLARHGAPVGTFSLVVGQQAGADLVQADGIEAVAFTGSERGGMALRALAEQRTRVIPFYAEMGTVNPVVVTPAGAGRMGEVAAGFVGSFTLGVGQYCTKPGLMLAPVGHDAAAAVGDALATVAPSPIMLTRAISESVTAGLQGFLDDGASVVRSVAGPNDGWSAPAAVLSAPISALKPGSSLLAECFGAVALVVEYAGRDELGAALDSLQGSLAGTVIAGRDGDQDALWAVEMLTRKVGRVTVGDWPTGVAYSWAQTHGGPWPATSDQRASSVGAAALDRFVRPVTYQSVPDAWLPDALRSGNPWQLPRRIDGVQHR